MIRSLTAVPFFVLALAAAPLSAQSPQDGADPDRAVASETGTGSMQDISARTWSDEVREVFFTDDTMQSLRPTGEISDRWGTLDPGQKETAIRDCQAYLMDAGSMGGASTGGLGGAVTPEPGQGTPDPNPEGGDGMPSASDSTASSDAPASPGDASAWTQACSLVTSFK